MLRLLWAKNKASFSIQNYFNLDPNWKRCMGNRFFKRCVGRNYLYLLFMPDISICSTYSVWIRIFTILEKSSSTCIYIKCFLKIGKYCKNCIRSRGFYSFWEIWVRLLFECGLYLREACITFQPKLWPQNSTFLTIFQ